MSKGTELRNDLEAEPSAVAEAPSVAPESSPQPSQAETTETGQAETSPQVGEGEKPPEAKAEGENWEKRYKDIESHKTKIEQENKALRDKLERIETETELQSRAGEPEPATSQADSITKFAKKHKLTTEEAEAFSSMVDDIVSEKLTPMQERVEAQAKNEVWKAFAEAKKDWKEYEPEMAEMLRKNPWMTKLPNAPFHLYALVKDQNSDKVMAKIREEVRRELMQKKEADATAPGISGERTAPAEQGSKGKDALMEAFTSSTRRGGLRQQLS